MKEYGSVWVDRRNKLFSNGRRLVSASLILAACSSGHSQAVEQPTTPPITPESNPTVPITTPETTNIHCDIVIGDTTPKKPNLHMKLTELNSLDIEANPQTPKLFKIIQLTITSSGIAKSGIDSSYDNIKESPPHFILEDGLVADFGVDYDPVTQTDKFTVPVCDTKTYPTTVNP